MSHGQLLRALALMIAVMLTTVRSAAQGHGGFTLPFDDWNRSFSAGFRFGIDLGGNGVIVGLEASYVGRDRAFIHGPVVGFDYWRSGIRVQLGYEAITFITLGAETGPTVMIDSKGAHLGWHITPFAGIVGFPYYQATIIDNAVAHEVGLFLKRANRWREAR